MNRMLASLGFRLSAQVLLLLGYAGCGVPPQGSLEVSQELREALTFHASFDHGLDADFSLGDPRLYTASSLKREEVKPGLHREDVVFTRGRHGNALHFLQKRSEILFYRAGGNVDYRGSHWSGTVSFWLSLDPEEDLEPGYSDPLMITERGWDDGALFVDFTRDDRPRHFRLGVFADRSVWNPDNLSWEEIDVENRPMVAVRNPPFGRDRWTHVLFTFEGFNMRGTDSRATLYLNGRQQGSLQGRRQLFRWDLDETAVILGLDYIGKLDEVTIFNRALTPDEIRLLHRLEYGAGALHGG